MAIEDLAHAIRLHQAGRLAEAEAIYRQILTRHPDQPDALHMLGVLAGQVGQLDTAVDLVRRAIRIAPDNPELQNNLGITLSKREQFDEAIAAFRQAIRLRPNYAEAHKNLGLTLEQNRQFDDAIAEYRQAIRINQNDAEAHNNLAGALESKRQFADAIASLNEAIRIKPDFAEAHNNLGNVFIHKLNIEQAIACFQQAIRFKPDYAEAYSNLGSALVDIGQPEESIADYRQAIRLKPDLAGAHSNLIYALQFRSIDSAQIIQEELRRWNQQHALPLRKFIRPQANTPDPDRRLRIGYISADFVNHSVSRFLLPLFREHDRGAYEIVCYSDVSNSDSVTDRLCASADDWQSIIGWTDERVAEKVREDKIDILVDLAGHTARNRLRVFARKPAPVQISYLGYPGTTGLSEMDYRLTDSLADPPGETESLHSEKLLRLPVCNWCFSEPDDAPSVGPLPAQANGSIRFGTFNNFAKASPAIIDLWAAILIAIPSSRLIIKSRGLGENKAPLLIHQRFASRGISADRLEIHGHQPTTASHLAAYNQIDIALDTSPYHGTTTTCEALWMGVPVVTLAGLTHISRVGVSLLSNVGLPELIAQSPDEYVSIAVEVAKDLPRLAEFRRTLRPRMRASPLMDAPRFARDIQAAYRQTWRIWCEQTANSGLQCPSE
jgi:predicted O-linked N-acetylglucosamine transferase (SPINDLY family)